MPETDHTEGLNNLWSQTVRYMIDSGINAVQTQEALARIRNEDVTIADTPSEVVFRSDKVTLSRYTPVTDLRKDVPPVMITYGIFGRQTMIDLQEGRSLVRNLLDAGLDVYVVDWGNPTRADRYTTLDDLICGYLKDCAEFLVEKHDGKPITLFGICEGGTFAACLAALEPQLFQGLAISITPIDFKGNPDEFWEGEGFLNLWIQNLDEADINKLVDTYGNMPGELSGAMFSALTPINSMTKYSLGLARLKDDEAKMMNFLRMEKWIADRPDHPGEAAKQWFNDLYRENQLTEGKMVLDGRIVDLRDIKCEVLNIFALKDHIVPVSCSKPMGDFIPEDRYTEIGFPGGHVGVFVSSKAQGVVAGGFIDWMDAKQKT
ncbi:MAG: alpha/beta fold hydrolase [Pseudomonadota bacterium]